MKLKAKPLVSMVCALAMCAAMLPAQVLADNQPEETPASTAVSSADKSVTIDKTASDEYLNTSLETNVTLTVSGQETKDKVAVLFVFDKSTSTDVRNAAQDLIGELAKKDNTDIKFAIVNFDANAAVTTQVEGGSGWLDFDGSQADSYDQYFGYAGKSGTNYHTGLLAAKDLLASPDIAGHDVYLITVSDGITYIWNDGDSPKTTWSNLDIQQAAGSATQNGASTWEFKYKDANGIHGFEYLYDGGIEDFLTIAESAYNQTKEAGLFYNNGTSLQEGTKVSIFEATCVDSKVTALGTTAGYKEVGADGKTLGELQPVSDVNYLIAPEAASYKTAVAFQELVTMMEESGNGNHIYALCAPENDQNDQWASNPYGKELMGYLAGLTDTAVDNSPITNSTAADTFQDIKNEIMYAIESGSITDVIGSNFDLASLSSFNLTVGGVAMDKVVDTDSNTITFYAPEDSQHTTALYTLTYDPSNVGGEQFTLAINTPVEKDKPLNLTYTVKLVNVEQEAGVYSVPTNESATLTYQPSVGSSEESLTFPVPIVKYRVAQVRPADITIYQGGNNGYEGVMGETEISGSDSLPEPGYYINLPEDVNTALKDAGLADGDTPAELSEHISISTVDEQSKWSIASYGKTYSQALGQYIYAITPDKDTETAPFRLNFIAEDGEVYDEDNFSPAKYGALNATYTMQIYPELVNSHQVVITVTVGDNTYSCIMTTKTGDLNIRYVTGDQDSVVTSSFTSVEEASKKDNPNKTALDKAYVIRDEDTKFFINDSDVDVTETEGFADVSLLFDDIVTDGNTEGASDYYSMLTDKAVDEAAEGMQDVKYEAKYLDLVDANNGNVWLTPSEKVTIYWPYPDGTDANTTFKLVHFKDLDREMNLKDVAAEIESAEIETLTVTTDAYGISFQTDSFSPYVLLWDNSQSTTVIGTPTPDEHPDIAEAIANGTWGQPTPTPAPAVIPQTSDDMPITLLIGAAGVAAAGIVVLVILRKRKRNQ